MKIRIIQTGKTKEKYFIDSVEEYHKRLKPYIKIEFITTKETEDFLKFFNKDNYTVLLDEKGKELDSVQFSKIIKENINLGRNIDFVIGGQMGFSQTLKEQISTGGGYILSLSKMTFTHQMIRLFLIEQIYRSICICLGKEYHVA